MTNYTETLNALATAAAKAAKAEGVTNDKTTAHAPFALDLILSANVDFDAVGNWIGDACKAANLKSAKGKRNLQALRPHGGLYNLANSLKWFADNREEYPAIDAIAYAFCRNDIYGDMRRDYLVASKAMLPAEANASDVDGIAQAYHAIEDDKGKAKNEDAYWVAIKAPSTFAAFMKECKAYVRECKAQTADKFADKVARMVEAIDDLELAELRKRQTELLALMTAIEKASEKIALADSREGEPNVRDAA